MISFTNIEHYAFAFPLPLLIGEAKYRRGGALAALAIHSELRDIENMKVVKSSKTRVVTSM